MNTVRFTSTSLFTSEKLTKAINRLENLCNHEGQQIIECLKEYDGLPFIDLLIKTGLDAEDLQKQLDQLVESGMLISQEQYYTTEYFLNTSKLLNITMLASILAKR